MEEDTQDDASERPLAETSSSKTKALGSGKKSTRASLRSAGKRLDAAKTAAKVSKTKGRVAKVKDVNGKGKGREKEASVDSVTDGGSADESSVLDTPSKVTSLQRMAEMFQHAALTPTRESDTSMSTPKKATHANDGSVEVIAEAMQTGKYQFIRNRHARLIIALISSRAGRA